MASEIKSSTDFENMKDHEILVFLGVESIRQRSKLYTLISDYGLFKRDQKEFNDKLLFRVINLEKKTGICSDDIQEVYG